VARLLTSLAWTALFALVVVTLLDDHQARKRAHVVEEMSLLTSRVDATVQSLGAFARYAWETSVNQPRVTSMVHRAMEAGEPERTRLRGQLHALLLPQYERMTRYHFRQVHFHFPDGTSFLRMHSPRDFGDNVAAVRHTVRIANETHRPVTGFEEGRTFNGYRYVYPLADGPVHCGSVELSFSMESFMEVLSRLTPAKFAFAVDRRAVEGAVDERNRGRYADSPLSPRLMHDRSVGGGALEEPHLVGWSPEMERKIDAGADFGIANRHEGESRLTLFKSVRNVLGENVGWIISVSRDTTVDRLEADLRRMLALATVAWLVIVTVSWALLIDRQKLAALSATDPLTGLLNRRSFEQRAARQMADAAEFGASLSLVMMDIDHFKPFNDTWGHAEGDRVIAGTARRVARLIRSGDLLARWGGEEFVLLLPRCGAEHARQIAEKIRGDVGRAPLSRHRAVTLSLGVTAHVDGESFDAFVGRADAALYEAKAQGRDRAVVKG
jgi:diguanylate cyclase (GGDEF)-like protein